MEEIPNRMSSEDKIDSHGGVAQLGEHLPCKQGVRSSNLLVSTISLNQWEYTVL